VGKKGGERLPPRERKPAGGNTLLTSLLAPKKGVKTSEKRTKHFSCEGLSGKEKKKERDLHQRKGGRAPVFFRRLVGKKRGKRRGGRQGGENLTHGGKKEKERSPLKTEKTSTFPITTKPSYQGELQLIWEKKGGKKSKKKIMRPQMDSSGPRKGEKGTLKKKKKSEFQMPQRLET